LARLQIAVTGGVVLSFLLGSAAAWSRARAIDADVDGIVGNAMPSVHALAAARSAVHRLDSFADQYAQAAIRGVVLSDVPVRACRHDLHASLATYRSFPFFSTEASLNSDVRDSVALLEPALDRLTAAAQQHDLTAVNASLVEVHAQSDRAEEALARLVNFNATQGQRLGLDAARTRRDATVVNLMFDAMSVLLAALATVLAVIALRRSVQSLEKARVSASERASASEQRSNELEQFAGSVAHDVLSPLASVGLSLELAKMRLSGDAKAQDSVGRGIASLRRVQLIVVGLLEFARAGAKPTPDAFADVCEVLEDVTCAVRGESEVEIVAEPCESCRVACSPGVLTSVMANLVRNAVKYIGDGPIRRVSVRAAVCGDYVRVEVEDTGHGIAPEVGDAIFEPFVRANTNQRGIGLGLATVKRLVNAHGGRLGYRSQPGMGSTFWFELPCARVVPQAGDSGATKALA
jgi:signal transduction histidine kinase